MSLSYFCLKNKTTAMFLCSALPQGWWGGGFGKLVSPLLEASA